MLPNPILVLRALAAVLLLPSLGLAAVPGAPIAPIAPMVATVISDDWYAGEINGQPAASMHVVVTPDADGGFATHVDTTFVLKRSLGTMTAIFKETESDMIDEGADGHVRRFSFDQNSNGEHTTAIGRADAASVDAVVSHLERQERQHLPTPAGKPLLGSRATMLMIAAHPPVLGASIELPGLVLVGDAVRIVATTYRLKDRHAGNLHYRVLTDIIPIPADMSVGPTGRLLSMGMDLGFMKLELDHASGPVALLPASLASTGLVHAAGPPPARTGVNRYRLGAATPSVLTDPFQSCSHGVLTVRSIAPPSPLADPSPFLAKAHSLEIDDPALRAWVHGIVLGTPGQHPVDIAERLRMAVRALIVDKDLNRPGATALDAFRHHEGDCTGHANLLCAALRIAGIPARTEVGLVYAEEFQGWCGHAWDCAYLNGRWVLLDSAYPGHARSQYIALASPSDDTVDAWAQLVRGLKAVSGVSVEHLPPKASDGPGPSAPPLPVPTTPVAAPSPGQAPATSTIGSSPAR